jgi:hypothetical protein
MAAPPTFTVRGPSLTKEQYEEISPYPLSRSQLRRRIQPELFGTERFTSDTAIEGDFPKGLVDRGIPKQFNRYTGYLAGTRPPEALNYAINYFIPNGPYAETALPLTQQTYEQFLKDMYRAFYAGQLAGQVSFDPPSMEDIRTVLSSNEDVAWELVKIPHGTGQHVALSGPPPPGLPGAKFTPAGERKFETGRKVETEFPSPIEGSTGIITTPIKSPQFKATPKKPKSSTS